MLLPLPSVLSYQWVLVLRLESLCGRCLVVALFCAGQAEVPVVIGVVFMSVVLIGFLELRHSKRAAYLRDAIRLRD